MKIAYFSLQHKNFMIPMLYLKILSGLKSNLP